AAVLASLLIGGTLLAALVAVELRLRDPMLDLRILRDRMFRNGNLAAFVAMGCLIGVVFLLPFYLQQLRGVSALESGLATAPQPLGMICGVPISSRLYPRVGPRRMMLIGFSGFFVISILFMFLGLDTELWLVRG